MAINPVTGTRIQRPVAAPATTGEPSKPAFYLEPESEFGRGLRRGTAQIASGAQQTLAAGQAALGYEEAAQENLEEAATRTEAVEQEFAPRVGRVEDIHSVGDAVDFMSQLLGSQTPILGSLAATSLLGGAAGARVAGTARGATIGATAGAGAGSAGLETGLIFGDIAADPEARGTLQEQALVSGAGGLVAGSLDALPIFQGARRLGVADPVRRGIVARAARAAVPQAASEGLTEAAQTLVERGTHKFVNRNLELLGPEGASEVLNAAVAGTLLGGGLGAVTGALQRPGPTDNDLIDEAEADEVTNRMLLERRVEMLRADGRVPAEELDAYLSEAVVDDALLDELDARTPVDILENRKLDLEHTIAQIGERDPPAAMALLKERANEGSISRREMDTFLQLAKDGLQGGGNTRAITENILLDLNPELAQQLLADEDFEPGELGVRRELSPSMEAAGSFEEFADASGLFPGVQEGEDAVDPGIGVATERTQEITSQTGRSPFFLTPEKVRETNERKGRTTNEGNLKSPEQRIADMEDADPGNRYEWVPALDAIRESIDKAVADPELRQEMFLTEAQKLANARGVELDPANPQAVFEGNFQVRKVITPQEITGASELDFDEQFLSASIPAELKGERARAEQKESARVAVLRANVVRPAAKAKDSVGFMEPVARVYRDSEQKKEFLMDVRDDTRAVHASFLTKVMLRKLRQSRDRVAGTSTARNINYTEATLEEVAEAFAAGLAGLMNVRRDDGQGFVDVSMEGQLDEDLVILADKNQKPLVTMGQILDSVPGFRMQNVNSLRSFRDSFREAGEPEINFLEQALQEGIPMPDGTRRQLTEDEQLILGNRLAAINAGRDPNEEVLPATRRRAPTPFTERSVADESTLREVQLESGERVLEPRTREVTSQKPVATAGVHPEVEFEGAGGFAGESKTALSQQRLINEIAARNRANQEARKAREAQATAQLDLKPTPPGKETADRILSKEANADTQRRRDEFKRLKGRMARRNALLKTKVRLVDTTSMANILLQRNDLERLAAINEGRQQGLTLGETVWVNPDLSPEGQAEILDHEIGHVIAQLTQPKNLAPIYDAWNKWRMEVKNRGAIKDVEKARKTLKLAIEGSGSLTEYNIANMPLTELNYILDFEEWFADQIAAWFATQDRSTSSGKWAQRFVGKMRQLFGAARDDESIADDTVRHFIEKTLRTDTLAQARVYRATIRDSRAPAVAVVTNPSTQYAQQALLAMLHSGWLEGKPANALARVFASNSTINRKVQDIIRPHSPADADRASRDWQYATAIGFALWSQGHPDLQLGPAGQDAFERLTDTAFRALGEPTDFEQAKFVGAQVKEMVTRMQAAEPSPNEQALINILSGGQMGDRSSAFSVSEALRDTWLRASAQVTKDWWNRYFGPLMRKVFQPAQQRLVATGNAALVEIANRFAPAAGTKGRGEGYLPARSGEISRWQDRMARALGKDITPELAQEVLTAKQQGTEPQSAEAKRIARELSKVFDDMFDYAKQANLPLSKRKNYFPWVYDLEQLIERKEEFIEMLLSAAHDKPMQGMTDSYNAKQEKQFLRAQEAGDIPDTEVYEPISKQDMAEMIYAKITQDEGYLDTASVNRDVRLKESLASHIPYVGAMNERNLNFLQATGDQQLKDKHQSFLSQDLNQTLRTYSEQLVKRAEFTRRFWTDTNTGRTEVDELMEDAARLGATPQEMRLAEDFVAAMQGTIGFRTNQLVTRLNPFTDEEAPAGQVINPKLQTTFSSIILWQNMRVLALAGFTSLVDPMGIAVRGGGLDVSFAALKAAGKVADRSYHSTKVAEGLGIIDTYSIDEALASTFGTNFMTGRTRLWNERFFKWTGLATITRVSRAAATGGALQFLKRHSHDPVKHSKRFLDELNLTPEDVQLDENGEVRVLTRAEITGLHDEITRLMQEATDQDTVRDEVRALQAEINRDARIRGAIRRFVDESILRPSAATRPIWASDPHFQLVFHLKSFMYTFHDVILRRIFNEAANYNFSPAVLAALTFVPVMIAADYMRDLAKFGEEDPKKADWDIVDWAWNGVERSGLMGLGMMYTDAQQDRQFGGLGIESFLGPFGGSLRDVDDLLAGPDRWDALIDQLPGQNTVFVNATLR